MGEEKEPCPTCGELYQKGRGVATHHHQVHGESIGGVEYNCKNCGEKFRARDRDYKTYCSRQCMSEDYGGRDDIGNNPPETPTGKEHPNWVEKKEFVCKNCEEIFIDYKHKKRIFCSRDCDYEYKREERSCQNCGQEFIIQQSIEKKFCSYKCSVEDKRGDIDKDKWEEKECSSCSKLFDAYKNYNRKYCSNECRFEGIKGEKHPRWRGGTEDYYGPSFTEPLKREVREETNNKCFKCGIDQEDHWRKLDVHHIVPFDEFGLENHEEANKKENLVALCNKCHMAVEFGDSEL